MYQITRDLIAEFTRKCILRHRRTSALEIEIFAFWSHRWKNK